MEKCVFICDDDLDILDICRMILEGDGLKVVTCTSAESLQRSLTEHAPDLIFVDNSLIGVSGKDLIKGLKQDDKYKSVPILLFSANSEIERLAQSASADGYLAKPFDIAELKKTVQAYVV